MQYKKVLSLIGVSAISAMMLTGCNVPPQACLYGPAPIGTNWEEPEGEIEEIENEIEEDVNLRSVGENSIEKSDINSNDEVLIEEEPVFYAEPDVYGPVPEIVETEEDVICCVYGPAPTEGEDFEEIENKIEVQPLLYGPAPDPIINEDPEMLTPLVYGPNPSEYPEFWEDEDSQQLRQFNEDFGVVALYGVKTEAKPMDSGRV